MNTITIIIQCILSFRFIGREHPTCYVLIVSTCCVTETHMRNSFWGVHYFIVKHLPLQNDYNDKGSVIVLEGKEV